MNFFIYWMFSSIFTFKVFGGDTLGKLVVSVIFGPVMFPIIAIILISARLGGLK